MARNPFRGFSQTRISNIDTAPTFLITDVDAVFLFGVGK